MRRTARLATFLAATLFAATACHAAPASRESVEAMFATMSMDKTIASTVEKMQNFVRQSIANMPQTRGLTPAQRQQMDRGLVDVDAMLRDELTWAKLEPELVGVYAATFTQDEIDGQAAFYRTPAGQALIAKTPELTERTLAAMQTRLQALMPRLQQKMESALKAAAAASTPASN